MSDRTPNPERVGLNLLTLDYATPEPEVEQVEVETLAGHIEVNDLLVSDGVAYRVTAVKVGTKWTKAVLDGGKKMDVANETPVTVLKTQVTKASAERGLRAYRNARLAGMLAQRDTDYAAKVEKFMTAAATGSADSWRLGDFLSAQAEKKLLDRLAHVAEGNFLGLEDLVEAREALVEKLREEIFDGYRFSRALSRSASTCDNLLDDVDREATVEFIREAQKGWM